MVQFHFNKIRHVGKACCIIFDTLYLMLKRLLNVNLLLLSCVYEGTHVNSELVNFLNLGDQNFILQTDDKQTPRC